MMKIWISNQTGKNDIRILAALAGMDLREREIAQAQEGRS